ncbi:D-aminoacyl-tRNA deacylase [Halovivax sp.]|uniref:D-aminoacyl-tRNA deacylase n=1 Tax=Halovivax sp. TaxID=1935978 RepID=UPI0025C02188|nr:D-aminoacyl-tRNA deacylase [Halovivax sp.]
MIAIVESRDDSASVHVCDRIRELEDWERREDDSRPDADGGAAYLRTDGFELRSFDDLHLELERPAEAFDVDPELLVFASRHSGETGPLLTGHFTGNFGPAEYGGEDRALSQAAPNALVHLHEAFLEHAPDGYAVGLECTHHGPTDVGCPSLFAELGSGEDQWADPAGAEAVARAILDLRGVDADRDRQIVGFGGGHYVPRFERIVRETPWAVGHVAPAWALEELGDPSTAGDLFREAFERSGAELAVIDGDRPALASTVASLGYRVVSEGWLREVADRPRSLVDAVEAELGPIADGVRFGDRRADAFSVASLPSSLVSAAEGIDPDRARAVVAERAVAFETTNGGSRVGDRAALPEGESVDDVVEALADLLRDRYESVRVTDDAVVAEETAFDPERAAELGVPEGPEFGRLSAGEPVTVDGERIDPSDVHVETTTRFPR